ncbi:MFS transporter [Sphingomonas sp. BIUV-7]|uniref:MFS transporter n=1 Tax=Sphingomonas natans TaxID=3063330 RepID=A0ABT8Y7T5_9SPHN|nr:MFS transporter [Sphingomonas sp. BIUV-7]MDO6414072.1 MFS transporter [Sphingomonas sp. BIUV-7]
MAKKSSSWLEARWIAAIVLLAVYTLHSLDRYVFGVVIEPLRHEFHLSDAQLGAIGGSAHAIGFCVCVLPVGWLMDRTNRVKFLSTMLAIWSAVSGLGAFATGYWSLFTMRTVVGAAESSTASGTQSLVASIFPVKERASAMGLVHSGLALGTGLAFVIGGFVAQHFGWRAVFLVVGLPGIILAAFMWLKFPEPSRSLENGDAGHAVSMWQSFKFFLRTRSVFFNTIGLAIVAMNIASIWIWITPILVREQGFSLATAGLIVGIAAGVLKFASTALSGFLADWVARGRVDRLWIVPSCALTLSVPVAFGIAFAPSPMIAALLVFVLGLTLGTHYSAPKAAIVTATPPRMRGSIAALQELVANLGGAAIGPLITGIISDKLGGTNSVSLALGATVSLNLIAAASFWFGIRNSSASTSAPDPGVVESVIAPR